MPNLNVMERRLESIIESIKSGTKKRSFLWEPTERKTEYRLRLKSGIINVDKWLSTSDPTSVSHPMTDISFHNELGERIERLAFSKLDSPDDYRKLAELHELARRSILKVDETLDRIFSEIESKGD